MFAAIRSVPSRIAARAFSISAARYADLAKVILIGNLARDPDSRQTRNEKEYVVYTVITNSYNSPNADGERQPTVTWHKIFSFNESPNQYLRTLRKGCRVYVEATYDVREPEPNADPKSFQSQRQILLRHESIRVLNYPRKLPDENENKPEKVS